MDRHSDVKEETELSNLLKNYLHWMRIQNYSERTVEDRERYLSLLLDWLEMHEIESLSSITPSVLRRYQRYLYAIRKSNDSRLSFRSQRNRLVPVKSFFKWLVQQGHLEFNPASDLEMPRMEKRLPKAILSSHEVEQVLNEPDVTTGSGIRDRAILEVLYSTGIRRNELVGLKCDDLDYERGTLMVRQGKGKKDRMIPIGERALKWVRKYVEEVRDDVSGEQSLFLHRKKSLSLTWLSDLVSKYIRESDIEKEGSCHLFRHSMATAMLDNGADLRFIQQMLGHSDLSTTQIYTQVSIMKLKEVHTQTHPAKLK